MKKKKKIHENEENGHKKTKKIKKRKHENKENSNVNDKQ